jgi:hypothetical protein
MSELTLLAGLLCVAGSVGCKGTGLSFPENASASQLHESLAGVNLAYVLNTGAHVAMSYPSLWGAQPADTADVRFVELKAKLERLFQEYRPKSGKS